MLAFGSPRGLLGNSRGIFAETAPQQNWVTHCAGGRGVGFSYVTVSETMSSSERKSWQRRGGRADLGKTVKDPLFKAWLS